VLKLCYKGLILRKELYSVADTFSNDSSIITLSSNTARDLQLCCGSTVLVKGEKGKYTLLVVLEDDDLEDSGAKVNQVIRYNLQVRLNEYISVYPCSNLRFVCLSLP
jgi:transitional endoplasmic reticulum ATPase